MHSRICEIVKEVMGVNIGKMPENAKFSDIPSWDSFNNLMLVSRLEDEFRIRFTAVEVEQTQTVGELFSLLERKIGKGK